MGLGKGIGLPRTEGCFMESPSRIARLLPPSHHCKHLGWQATARARVADALSCACSTGAVAHNGPVGLDNALSVVGGSCDDVFCDPALHVHWELRQGLRKGGALDTLRLRCGN